MKSNEIELFDVAFHTGEVVGSIPTAPTIEINNLEFCNCDRAHEMPMK
jgi:hypothetical protein